MACRRRGGRASPESKSEGINDYLVGLTVSYITIIREFQVLNCNSYEQREVSTFSFHIEIGRKAEYHDTEVRCQETIKVLHEQSKSSLFRHASSLCAPDIIFSSAVFQNTPIAIRLFCVLHRFHEKVLLPLPLLLSSRHR